MEKEAGIDRRPQEYDGDSGKLQTSKRRLEM